MQSDAIGVRLDMQLRLGSGVLDVHFSIMNETTRQYGCFCRLPSVSLDGTPAYLPDTVYVDFQDESARLSKLVLPVPEGLKVTERVLPGIVLIPSHERLIERIAVTLPIVANNPYRQALLISKAGGRTIAPVVPRTVTEVTLAIGVFETSDAEKYLPISPAYPRVFRIWPPGGAVMRQIVLTATAPLDSPVPALDYGPAS